MLFWRQRDCRFESVHVVIRATVQRPGSCAPVAGMEYVSLALVRNLIMMSQRNGSSKKRIESILRLQ